MHTQNEIIMYMYTKGTQRGIISTTIYNNVVIIIQETCTDKTGWRVLYITQMLLLARGEGLLATGSRLG